MPENGSQNLFLSWARERLQEMDAMLASLDVKGAAVQPESRAKADKLLADLRKNATHSAPLWRRKRKPVK